MNANHNRNYEAYLLGQLKPGGWWYYFIVAFVFKATLPTLIFLLLAVIQTISSGTSRIKELWGQTILLSGIAFYTVAYSAEADNLGVRYLLPVFPLLYVWASQIVPNYRRNSFGRATVAILLSWHIWAALSSFPNYIPYFNEMAGGSTAGPDFLDDSNVDWGESLKETAAYVKEKQIANVVLCPFSAFMNPEYYGLHSTVRPPKQLVFKKPEPGTYIISAHNIAWMKAVDAMWRNYQPIDRIGGMWVYRF